MLDALSFGRATSEVSECGLLGEFDDGDTLIKRTSLFTLFV